MRKRTIGLSILAVAGTIGAGATVWRVRSQQATANSILELVRTTCHTTEERINATITGQKLKLQPGSGVLVTERLTFGDELVVTVEYDVRRPTCLQLRLQDDNTERLNRLMECLILPWTTWERNAHGIYTMTIPIFEKVEDEFLKAIEEHRAS